MKIKMCAWVLKEENNYWKTVMHIVAQRCVCLIYRGIGGSQVDWGGVGIAILVAHTSRTTSARIACSCLNAIPSFPLRLPLSCIAVQCVNCYVLTRAHNAKCKKTSLHLSFYANCAVKYTRLPPHPQAPLTSGEARHCTCILWRVAVASSFYCFPFCVFCFVFGFCLLNYSTQLLLTVSLIRWGVTVVILGVLSG